MRWLAENGIEGSVARTGTFAVASLPAERAEQLLAAPGAAAAAGRAGGSAPATVPAELQAHVESVEILSDAPVAEPATAMASADQVASASRGPHTSAMPRSGTPKGCPEGTTTHSPGEPDSDSAFTPNQYLKAYGHRRLHKLGARGQGGRVAVVEIDGFSRSDVETFGACFGIRIPPTPVSPVGIPAPLPPGSETTLDIEILSAAAPGLKSIDVYEGGTSAPDILATSAAALGPKGRHPEAISISIVVCEFFLKLKGGKPLVRSANEVYALAAGAGISVFGAAGDHGSTGCAFGEIIPALFTSFPASSPWVTAVGGTNLRLSARNRIVKERVWNDAPIQAAGGGGGISRIGARPFYQGGARYRQLAKRRLVPDISGLADIYPGYAIYCSAQVDCASQGWLAIGGTSVSTPLNAGGVVLANQLARRAGQPPLGFVNPLLYHLGRGQGHRDRVFNDVIQGNNNLTQSISAPVRCCTATKNWDRASGWGSIRFPQFVKRALEIGG